MPELYNVTADVSEQRNLILANPKITNPLLRKLGQWQAACPAPLYMEGLPWSQYHLDHYDFIYPLVQPARNENPKARYKPQP